MRKTRTILVKPTPYSYRTKTGGTVRRFRKAHLRKIRVK